jgi:hypothetical protein
MATTSQHEGVLTALNVGAQDSAFPNPNPVVVSKTPPLDGGRGGSSALDDSALTDEPQTLEMNFGKGLLPDEAKAEFRPGAVAWKGLGNTQAQQLPLETNSLPKLNPKPFAKKET